MGRGSDDEEFEELFDSFFSTAQRVAYRVVGDAQVAEDLAAEAFVRLYVRWGRLRNDPGRTGWVLKVTANLAVDTLRRQAHPLPPMPDPTPGPEDAQVLHMALSQALLLLPRRQRAVVVLRYLADLTEEEVALALGISVGSVKTHRHRAVARLRQTLSPEEEMTLALDRI